MARKTLNVCYNVPTTSMAVATSGDDEDQYDLSVSVDAAFLHELSDHLHASDRREGPVTLFFTNRRDEENDE